MNSQTNYPIEMDKLEQTENGMFEITGAGVLRIVNTGGSSASEGGMGSGSSDDREKGDLSQTGEKSGNAASDNEETKMDPIGKNIKEKEAENKRDQSS